MQLQNKKTVFFSDFYKKVDGNFSSFWLGKLQNSLMTSGNKLTIEKLFKKAFINLKLQKSKTGLSYLLESLSYLRPTFKLNFLIKGGKKREFPVYLSKFKQYVLSINWLKSSIQSRKERFLEQKIFLDLIELNESKNHVLYKERDKLFKEVIKNRFKFRFKKKRKL